jgi:hypothetical protein
MVTASNDGFVKVWSLCNTSGGSFDVAELASVDTKCRITCMELHQVTLAVFVRALCVTGLHETFKKVFFEKVTKIIKM